MKVDESGIFRWMDVYYLVIEPLLVISLWLMRMLELARIRDSRF